jgi:hypothetical protein
MTCGESHPTRPELVCNDTRPNHIEHACIVPGSMEWAYWPNAAYEAPPPPERKKKFVPKPKPVHSSRELLDLAHRLGSAPTEVFDATDSREISNEAYASSVPIAEQCYELISSAPNGLIADEVQFLLSEKHQSVSSAISDLVKEGRLEYTDQKRLTRSNRRASVVKVRSDA